MADGITIATQNVGNKVCDKSYDGLDGPAKLSVALGQENIDILCLQEVNPRYLSKLKGKLENGYSVYGDFRYKRANGVLGKKWLEHFNEACPIVSFENPDFCRTKWLSKTPDQASSQSFFSFLPRVATIERFEELVVINLHLDHVFTYTKAKQLQVVLEIVKEFKDYQIIMTGDFNLSDKKDTFIDFAKELENLGIELLNQDNDTFFKAGCSTKLDHIFASKELKCEPAKTLDFGISDNPTH